MFRDLKARNDILTHLFDLHQILLPFGVLFGIRHGLYLVRAIWGYSGRPDAEMRGPLRFGVPILYLRE